MTRRRHEDENSAGQDSFLDIVANIVGILVILVLVVSVRAKNAPVSLSIRGAEQKTAQRTLAIDQATEASLHGNVLEVTTEMDEVERTKQIRFLERGQLALAVAQIEQEIERRRGELDAQARAEFDRHRAIEEAENRLQLLRQRQEQLARSAPGPVRVQSYPTPLSKAVNGHELHVQLRNGRVTIVPFEALVEELKRAFQQKVARMTRESELDGQLGPIDGFRMLYTIRRHDTPMREYEQTGRGASIVRVEEFELRPTSADLGEPLEVALAEGSAFRQALARLNPARTTVTVWTYPESFEAFRRLKEDLFHRGFATAARPLPEGLFIGGSPEGTRSAAQ